jgi:hypothetical protein
MCFSVAAHAAERERPKLVFLPGSVDGSVYVRADTDKTTVVSPRAHLRKAVFTERTNLDLVYTADIWTAASIDVRTAATSAVTEQRDELVAGVDHEQGVATVGAGYRFSREYDYLSNAGNLFLKLDAFKRTATFETRTVASFDHVGRAGDEYFREQSLTFGQWLGYTQVLTKRMLMQLAYELRSTQGYQASPYRYVAIGGGGTCSTASAVCLPEVLPERRIRHAGVVRLRGALTDRLSLGGAYRFYLDEWRVRSHTGLVDLAMHARRSIDFGVEYRFYWQTAATFYESAYETAEQNGYYTRDRELSPLHNSRVNARLQWRKPVGRRNNELAIGGLLGGTAYRYRDFIGLTRVYALEVTANVGVGF